MPLGVSTMALLNPPVGAPTPRELFGRTPPSTNCDVGLGSATVDPPGVQTPPGIKYSEKFEPDASVPVMAITLVVVPTTCPLLFIPATLDNPVIGCVTPFVQ
jgi:hypothetical protein